MTTPNCRTCNDTGLIPAEYGVQPCPMCEAWERRRENAWESRMRSYDRDADRLIAVLIVAIVVLLAACWWLLPGGRA